MHSCIPVMHIVKNIEQKVSIATGLLYIETKFDQKMCKFQTSGVPDLVTVACARHQKIFTHRAIVR